MKRKSLAVSDRKKKKKKRQEKHLLDRVKCEWKGEQFAFNQASHEATTEALAQVPIDYFIEFPGFMKLLSDRWSPELPPRDELVACIQHKGPRTVIEQENKWCLDQIVHNSRTVGRIDYEFVEYLKRCPLLLFELYRHDPSLFAQYALPSCTSLFYNWSHETLEKEVPLYAEIMQEKKELLDQKKKHVLSEQRTQLERFKIMVDHKMVIAVRVGPKLCLKAQILELTDTALVLQNKTFEYFWEDALGTIQKFEPLPGQEALLCAPYLLPVIIGLVRGFLETESVFGGEFQVAGLDHYSDDDSESEDEEDEECCPKMVDDGQPYCCHCGKQKDNSESEDEEDKKCCSNMVNDCQLYCSHCGEAKI